MTLARKVQTETAAIGQRRAAPAAVQRSAAATVQSRARTLQERLGNHATQVFMARSVIGTAGFTRTPVAFLDGSGEKKGGERKRAVCDDKCAAGGTYGNTECEIDMKSGLLTGRVTKEVFDKNPCTRPCVELHEGVHARKIAPICATAKKCTEAAKDDNRKYKCLDQFEADMKAVEFSTECAAYGAEETCLAERAKKPECKSSDGKKRFEEQAKMVRCYKGCFCKR